MSKTTDVGEEFIYLNLRTRANNDETLSKYRNGGKTIREMQIRKKMKFYLEFIQIFIPFVRCKNDKCSCRRSTWWWEKFNADKLDMEKVFSTLVIRFLGIR